MTIRHEPRDGATWETTYNHLSHIAAKPGTRLGAGDRVGDIGTTGYSTGCHLHFEVIVSDDFVDPATVLE